MELSVKLNAFEGPLDLLLHLIDKNKINIYDIPIVTITEQYLEYIAAMDMEKLDEISEFLVMAATLLEIKARMLLPKEEEGEEEAEDPRAELVQRLLEYRKYKYLGSGLRDLEIGSELLFYRNQLLPEEVAKYRPPVDLDEFLGDLNLSGLKKIFDELCRRQADRSDPIRSHFGEIEREALHIGDRLDYVKERVCVPGRHSFRSLFRKNASRLEIVVTFLAILELLHSGEIRLTEDSTRDDFLLEDNTGELPAAKDEESAAAEYEAKAAADYEAMTGRKLKKKRPKKEVTDVES